MVVGGVCRRTIWGFPQLLLEGRKFGDIRALFGLLPLFTCRNYDWIEGWWERERLSVFAEAEASVRLFIDMDGTEVAAAGGGWCTS